MVSWMSLPLILSLTLTLSPSHKDLSKTGVSRHRPLILMARAALGVSAERHPDAFYLAIEQVESRGILKPGERDCCVGLLQISQSYLEDARDWARRKRPELVAFLPKKHLGLRRENAQSHMVMMLYMERYAWLHHYDPWRMALLHKAGARKTQEILKRPGPLRRKVHPRDYPRTYLYLFGAPNSPRFLQAYEAQDA